MKSKRPATPFPVRRPAAHVAATLLLLTVVLLVPVRFEAPLRWYFLDPLTPFAALATVGLLFVPARRWTYASALIALGVGTALMFALLLAHLSDVLTGSNSGAWVLGIWPKVLVITSMLMLVGAFVSSRRVRRFFGYLNGSARVTLRSPRTERISRRNDQ